MMRDTVIDVWLSLNARLRRLDRLRTAAVAMYYVAILVGLLVMYGRGQFTAPAYIYQRF